MQQIFFEEGNIKSSLVAQNILACFFACRLLERLSLNVEMWNHWLCYQYQPREAGNYLLLVLAKENPIVHPLINTTDVWTELGYLCPLCPVSMLCWLSLCIYH